MFHLEGESLTTHGLDLDGTTVQSSSPTQQLALTSQSNLVLSAGTQGSMQLVSQHAKLDATQHMEISGRSVELSSGLNQPVEVDVPGGGLEADALTLSGSSVSSQDGVRGLSLVSRRGIEMQTGEGGMCTSMDPWMWSSA